MDTIELDGRTYTLAEIEIEFERLYAEADLKPDEQAKFLMNVLRGVVNKYKLEFSDFPVHFVNMLLAFRKTGRMNNRRIQEILISHAEWVKDGRRVDA